MAPFDNLITTQTQVLYLTTLREQRVTRSYLQTSMLVPRCGIEVCAYLFAGNSL
jgi:hypothetical protein